MGNIVDYVDKYGYASFAEKPICLEDMVVLCQLAYFKYDCFLKTFDDGITVEKLNDSPMRGMLVADPKYKKDGGMLLEAMAKSVRFKDAVVKFYVNDIETEQGTQFSAVTFLLADRLTVTAFRGTDETMLGWQEDFALALNKPIAGQQKATDYVMKVLRKVKGRLILGGHSKGGNLALYAGFTLHERFLKRIRKICALDAPGFRPEFIENTDYDSVKRKIIRVVPKSSVVGLLLNDAPKKIVIEARSTGMKQHNLYNWIIKDGKLVRTEISKGHLKALKTFNNWVLSLDEVNLEKFVTILSEALDDTGAKTTVEFKENVPKYVGSLLKAAGEMNEESKKSAGEFIRSYFEFVVGNVKDEMLESIQSSKISKFLPK